MPLHKILRGPLPELGIANPVSMDNSIVQLSHLTVSILEVDTESFSQNRISVYILNLVFKTDRVSKSLKTKNVAAVATTPILTLLLRFRINGVSLRYDLWAFVPFPRPRTGQLVYS